MEFALATAEIEEDETLAPLVASAVDLGVRWVDLLYPRNTETEGLSKTIDRLAEADLRVSAIGTPTRLGGEDASADQELLVKAIRIAADLDCPFVNTYFGTRSVVDDSVAIKEYRHNLLPCLEVAEDLGVTITLENEFDALGADPGGSDLTRRPESVRQLMEAVDSERFRLAFDPCNAHFAGVESFPGYYDAVEPFIGYLHVKDGHREIGDGDPRWKPYSDHGRDYRTCELGAGVVNWSGLLSRLIGGGYDGFVLLEPHAVPAHRAAAWRQAHDFLTGTARR